MIRLSLKCYPLVLVFFIAAGCHGSRNETPGKNVEKTFYGNGKPESVTTIVNGKKNGIQEYYFGNGNLASTVNFVNGKMQGDLKAYYPDGTLRIIAHYDSGSANGETRKFYKDGKIERIQEYNKGRLTYEKKYSEEGKILYEDHYERIN